jgi:cholesterol transport system auxiliary component
MIVNTIDGQTESRSDLEAVTTSTPRRDGRLAGAALALLASALVVGCGPNRPSTYYQLAVPGTLAPATAAPLPVTIIVGLPAAPDLYRENRVVYAVGDQKIGAYEYERWIGPPPELIRDVVLRNLRASGRYAGVYTPQGKAGGDYLLRMRLYEFKEQDSGNSVVGRLTMDVELSNNKTGDTVWQTYYNHDVPVSAKTVPDVVAALNTNVQMAANDIASGMDQYFAAHPPK